MLAMVAMRSRTIRGLLLATLVAGSAAASSACYVEPLPPPYADGYGPVYYDGYVVYYDDLGRPYYYPGGTAVWIPVTSPAYGPLVHHWYIYGPQYHRWYVHDGYRYYHYHYPAHPH
jgi:hypothetical protein